MRGRASGFYLGVIGIFLTGAGPVGAYFGYLFARDFEYFAASHASLALIYAVLAGVVLSLPGLVLIWMADVVNEVTALRAEVFAQSRAAQKTAIAMDNVAKAIEDAFLDGNSRAVPLTGADGGAAAKGAAPDDHAHHGHRPDRPGDDDVGFERI